ncbi:MAG: hypothetical protein QG658_633 [Patescibacteria group bacterium]|jgi:hypothetical protein|nr:hypothetical protein [Patescibacteria group bacterium]
MATKKSTKRSSTAKPRQVRKASSSGQYVANVPPPPKRLPKYTRWWQAVFFVPFLLIEFWLAWSFSLELLANCGYEQAYILPLWCEPNGKIYVALQLSLVLSLLALGLFAMQLAYKQGIRWKFLVIYTAVILFGQYMVSRLLAIALF